MMEETKKPFSKAMAYIENQLDIYSSELENNITKNEALIKTLPYKLKSQISTFQKLDNYKITRLNKKLISLTEKFEKLTDNPEDQ